MNLESHHQEYIRHHSLPRANFVDLEQYLGDWYVVAHIPAPYEQDAANAVNSYRWNDEADRIDIDYHHNVHSPDGPLIHHPQKATIADFETNAEWKVQFFGPFRYTYRILEVAPDYSWSVAGTPTKKFAWLLARKTYLEEPTFESLVLKLEEWGYDISKMRKVPQIWDLG